MLQPQQGAEQQLQRQQQQLDEAHQQMRQQDEQIGRVVQMLERQQRSIDQKAVCSAELRWVSGSDARKLPAKADAAAALSLFSIISRPTNVCLPAEVRVTASYIDADGNLVCTGALENAATQTSLTQSINLEIRPWNLREFLRWRNEPPQINSGRKQLFCFNPEGLAEATPTELERVAAVRVRTTVLSGSGGMSTVEVQLNIAR